MQSSLRVPVRDTAVRCRIAASGRVCAPAETIAVWRRQPVAHGGNALSVSFLKHAEDQTVVALQAVLSAIADAGWQQRSFNDWGVVAAPNFFGRITNAQTMQRFQKEGAWGISPHLIPHQSLHAVSGTISQALATHGPNFGIGGGPNSGPDAFMLGLALLSDGCLPGMWLVMTDYESEWIPNADSTNPPPACHGLALALTSAADGVGRSLAIRHARSGVSPSALYPDFQLTSFADELASGAGQWRLSDSHWLELETEVRP